MSSTFSIFKFKEEKKMIKCKKCKNPLPETAHFCPNCGYDMQPAAKKGRGRKQNESGEEARIHQTDFGGYYDDRIPEDAEDLKNRKGDNGLVLKFVLLGFGVAVVLAACITLLILFGGGEL